MTYFDRNGNKIEFDIEEMKDVDHGNCANVFLDKTMIFKKYYSNTTTVYRLKANIFDILKDINHESFIKLFEIYSINSKFNLLKFKINKKLFRIDSYTAQYYQKEKINVLYEFIDYLLDNFREIEILNDIFNENQIVTADLKRKNMIINSSHMIIVDPDMFYKWNTPNFNYKKLQRINKKNLLYLFRDICYSYIEEENKDTKKMLTRLRKLTDIDITESTEITYEISKRLGHVKRPINYFRK